MNFRRADAGELLGRLLWNTALGERGLSESWSVFKYHLLQAQEHSTLMSQKPGRGVRKPSWINRELLKKINYKNVQKWKQWQMTLEEYRDTVQACEVGFKEVKAQVKLSLSKV